MASAPARRQAFGAFGLALLLSTAGAPLGGRQTAPAPADAEVVGTVVDPDGSPVAGLDVGIVETDTGIHIFSSPPSYTVDSTTTGPDGAYAGTLPGAYVAGTETDADWIVTASRRPGPGQAAGAESSFEFEVNTAVQEAPPLPFWDVSPTVSIEGYEATVDLPGTAPPGMSVSTRLGPVGGAMLTRAGTGATFDLRALEREAWGYGSGGIAAQGTASADVRVAHREGRTIYHQSVVTPAVGLTGIPNLVPPSRGAPCTLTATDGRSASPLPCWATDGSFFGSVGMPTEETSTTVPGAEPTTIGPQPGLASITVDLPKAVDVESVFVRGCEGGCAVEVSADGSAWSGPVASNFDDRSSAVLTTRFAPVAQARLVRVSAVGPRLDISEISAWEARPPSPPVPVPAPGSDRAAPTGSAGTAAAGGEGDQQPLGLALLAALLLGAVGVATAGVSMRGPRSSDPWG